MFEAMLVLPSELSFQPAAQVELCAVELLAVAVIAPLALYVPPPAPVNVNPTEPDTPALTPDGLSLPHAASATAHARYESRRSCTSTCLWDELISLNA